ncbi:DUF1361 domain-containing protein [Nocardioides montaniterrae]
MSHLDVLRWIWHVQGDWMVWNTVLAWVPVGLAALLFRGRTTHGGVPWWLGLVVFGLFLPNAPYVVTDLIHLPPTIDRLGPDAPVATTVYPVYAVFIASGFVAYTLSLGMAGTFMERAGRHSWRLPLRLATHALCAIGIFLGRWPRLNSWEPFTDPHSALHRIGNALAWDRAPGLIATLFVVTTVGHFLTKAVLDAIGSARRPRHAG